MPKVKFWTDHLPTHGCGPLYSYNLRIGRLEIHYGVGGYCNIKPPMGLWRWYPYIIHYRGVATHLTLLNSCLTFIWR